MRSVSSRMFAGAFFGSVLLIGTANAQRGQAPAPAPGPAPQQPSSPGPTQPNPGPSQPSPGNFPGRTDPNQGRQPFPGQDRSNFPDMQQQRMFFFSGKVMLDDGTPPPDPVIIERVCNGVPRPEAYTDSKGRFSFQLGQNQQMIMDASTSSADMGGPMGMGRMGPNGTRGGNITERDLMGCELRASLAGFRSDAVSLAGRRSMDNPDIGTIVLHRLAKVDGFTFSATSAYAPKDAKKAYEKGREAAKKKKWADAEKELTKATSDYSQYAAAWFELGRVYQQQSKLEDAQRAYGEAIKADGKFISPYAQLASLAASQKKWDDTAEYTSKVIRLNPYYSPDIYFLSSVAQLNMNKLDSAEEHAREALKMDEKHRNPRISYLLGLILAQKQDYAGAAENIKTYLTLAPDASDADRVKQQLAEVEKSLAARTGGVPAQ